MEEPLQQYFKLAAKCVARSTIIFPALVFQKQKSGIWDWGRGGKANLYVYIADV